MNTAKIVEMLNDAGLHWTVDGDSVEPNEEDLELVLDKMARTLYDEPVGTTMTVAGLVMEKRPLGHDLYIYCGNYE